MEPLGFRPIGGHGLRAVVGARVKQRRRAGRGFMGVETHMGGGGAGPLGLSKVGVGAVLVSVR